MKRSNGIVVDADVARASADPSESQRALACARAMRAILDRGALCVAFDGQLQREWNEHQGRFARKWLGSMYARRRVRVHDALPPWATLRSVIAALSERPRGAAEKDLHLVELARHDGWKLVSLDDTARRIFAQACDGCTELAQLAWANPTAAEVLLWLEKGAEANGPRLGDEAPAPLRGKRRARRS
mgnify:CR=1 FL=1